MQEFYETNWSPTLVRRPVVSPNNRIENTWLKTSVVEILQEMSKFSSFPMLEKSYFLIKQFIVISVESLSCQLAKL